MKNRSLDILLSLYFVIRYLTIVILVYLIVGTYSIQSYGLFIFLYYISINYIAIKYGIIKEFDKRYDISKKDLSVTISLFLIIFNLIIFSLYSLFFDKFEIYEVLLLSIIPVVEFYLIKTKKEKQSIIDMKTKKAIDDYFQNKK